MPGAGWIKKAAGRGTHNHDSTRAGKAKIRENALDALGEQAVVLDAYAGPGAMWEAVYKPRGALYVGCDKQWYKDARLMYVCDNRRLLRAIDLAPFNVFDLDAFGSPWDCALIIARRRIIAPGERVAMFLTDGAKMGATRSSFSRALAHFAKIDRVPPSFLYADVTAKAVVGLADEMRCEIVHSQYIEGRKMPKVRYYALVLRGREAPVAATSPEPAPKAARRRRGTA